MLTFFSNAAEAQMLLRSNKSCGMIVWTSLVVSLYGNMLLCLMKYGLCNAWYCVGKKEKGCRVVKGLGIMTTTTLVNGIGCHLNAVLCIPT